MEGFILFLFSLVFLAVVVTSCGFLAWIMLFPGGQRWMLKKQMKWEVRKGIKCAGMRDGLAEEVRDEMIAEMERKERRVQRGR